MITSAPELTTNSKPVVIQNRDTQAQQPGRTVAGIDLGGGLKDERLKLRKTVTEAADVAGNAGRWGLNEF